MRFFLIITLFVIGESAHSNSTVVEAVTTVQKAVKAVNNQQQLNCTDQSCRDESRVPCSVHFDRFCSMLYSAENLGNMDVPLSNGEVIQLRFGDNDQNDSVNFARYLDARLKYRDNLPPDMKKALAETRYYQELAEYRKMKKSNTEQGRLADQEKWGKVSDEWRKAFNKVRLARLEKQLPGYTSKDEKDVEFDEIKRAGEITRELRAELNEALWKTSPEWKTIQAEFDKTKAEFIRQIQNHSSLSSGARNKMVHILRNLTLKLPGTNKDHIDDECAQTKVNASYNSFYNSVTICAGLIAAPTVAVMAHEIGHAIDPHILMYNDYRESSLNKSYENFFLRTCGKEKPSCEEWSQLKKDLEGFNLQPTHYYSERYLQCLRGKNLKDWPDEKEVVDLATLDINRTVDNFASDRDFTLLAAPELKDGKGGMKSNINYLNICKAFGYEEGKINFSYVSVLLLSYVNEFRCSTQNLRDQKLTEAIKKAKETAIRFNSKYISIQRSLAEHGEMMRRGYSTPIGEKAADNLGMSVAAEVLKNMTPDVDDRRKILFSSASLFCDEGSWLEHYRDLEAKERTFTTLPHSQDFIRRKELMTEQIRNVLDCDKNSEVQDCAL